MHDQSTKGMEKGEIARSVRAFLFSPSVRRRLVEVSSRSLASVAGASTRLGFGANGSLSKSDCFEAVLAAWASKEVEAEHSVRAKGKEQLAHSSSAELSKGSQARAVCSRLKQLLQQQQESSVSTVNTACFDKFDSEF